MIKEAASSLIDTGYRYIFTSPSFSKVTFSPQLNTVEYSVITITILFIVCIAYSQEIKFNIVANFLSEICFLLNFL